MKRRQKGIQPMMTVQQAAQLARQASWDLASLPETIRNDALNRMADALEQNREKIFEANRLDMEKGREEQLAGPLLARLLMDEKKLAGVIKGLRDLMRLQDPLGKTLLSRELTDGLDLYRITCPIGVLGIVFESRPDALLQIASLALKSGNAVLLKGGREALGTNEVLFSVIDEAARSAGVPEGWAHLLRTREDVTDMLSQEGLIDLLIPRGSNAFVRYIMEHTHIPVMGHADGLCHVYVDESADLVMAVKVTVDAKTQAYAVCNAAETLLVHEKIAPAFLPVLKRELDQKNVQLRGDDGVRGIISCEPATEEDWQTEYLDAILSVKLVSSLDEAIGHINRYGSHHTDTILTENMENARRFVSRVDSAGTYVNCSTRFADGYRYGFGAEVGIATGKLHARGPVGLEGLCTYKYVLIGRGQTVAETMSESFSYTHRDTDHPCPLA